MGGATDIVCTALTTVMTVLCVVAAGSFAVTAGIVHRTAFRGIGYILASLALPCLVVTTFGSQLTPEMFSNAGAFGLAVAFVQLGVRVLLALLGTAQIRLPVACSDSTRASPSSSNPQGQAADDHADVEPQTSTSFTFVDPSYRALIIMACSAQNGVAYPISMWRALAAVIGAGATVRRQTETLLFVSSIISGVSLWGIGYVTLARAVEAQRASDPVDVISDSEDPDTPLASLERSRQSSIAVATATVNATLIGETLPPSLMQCQVGIILGEPKATRLGELFDSKCWNPFSNAVCAMASRLPVPSWTRLLLTPPMISCAVGIAVGLTPLRQVIVSEAWPLRPIVQGAVVFGDLNIPLTMMLLGAILLPAPADSAGAAPSVPDSDASTRPPVEEAPRPPLKDRAIAFMMRSDVRFVAYVCAANLVVLPLVTYLGFRGFAAIVASGSHSSVSGDGVLPWLPPQHRNVFIASMLEAMAPSGALGVVICEMFSYRSREYGSMIAVQYAVSALSSVVWLLLCQ